MMKVACIAATLFGHTIFYTNFLGWLDAARLASPQFYAVTKDGREVWMPPVYFGIYSYSIAQTAHLCAGRPLPPPHRRQHQEPG